MNCDEVLLPELIRGELSEELAESVTHHLETCSSCRERARIMALLETEAGIGQRPARRRLRSLALAAAVAIAACLGLLFHWTERDRPTVDWATELATHEPYPFIGLTVRGSNPASETDRHAAFTAYRQRKYETAARLFRQLVPDAEVSFYLGVSLYLAGEPEPACVHLREAAKTSGWRTPARWYLANALLARRDVDSAKRILTGLEVEPGEFQEKARLLLDQLSRAAPPKP